jgi:RimJ/RimL family protein N-acetyltransferase
MFEMHQRLSLDSIYSRYLRAYIPSLDDLKDVCSIEEKEGFVLIASSEDPQEKVVGIAYYCVEPNKPSSAEPAILVEDEYQGRGLGKQLAKKLCQYARKLGVKEFVCYSHPANRRLLRMIERSGMRFESNYCDSMNKIRVLLNPIS